MEQTLVASQLDGGLTRANFLVALRSMDMTAPYLFEGAVMSISGGLRPRPEAARTPSEVSRRPRCTARSRGLQITVGCGPDVVCVAAYGLKSPADPVALHIGSARPPRPAGSAQAT